MKPTVEVIVKKEIPIKYLLVDVGPIFWCDCTVNGVQNDDDEWEGEGIPCKNEDRWQPIIDLENGQIVNWKIGTTMETNFKVCDNGIYTLTNENNITIMKKEGYVPNVLDPYNDGYGDYIILKIDENGFIDKFKAVFNDWENDDYDSRREQIIKDWILDDDYDPYEDNI